LLTEFEDVLAKGPNDLGCTDLTTHKIEVGKATPIRQQPRRLPIKQREEASKLIEEMQQQGVIEPSQSQ
jgi:hypothetical protein